MSNECSRTIQFVNRHPGNVFWSEHSDKHPLAFAEERPKLGISLGGHIKVHSTPRAKEYREEAAVQQTHCTPPIFAVGDPTNGRDGSRVVICFRGSSGTRESTDMRQEEQNGNHFREIAQSPCDARRG